MMRAAIASLLAALIFVGVDAGAGVVRAGSRASQPVCPHARYRVDGKMGPAFCVIDNPVALGYYAKFGRHLFALGASALPDEVLKAVLADFHNSTLPILCETYRLAAWREQWHFAGSITAAAAARMHWPKSWCSEPSFGEVDS